MIEYLDKFNINQFMKKHSLTIKVTSGREGSKCYLFHGDTPILHDNYAVYAFSKHSNKKDVLAAMYTEIITTVLTIDGKKVLVI